PVRAVDRLARVGHGYRDACPSAPGPCGYLQGDVVERGDLRAAAASRPQDGGCGAVKALHRPTLNVDDSEAGRYARTRVLENAGYTVVEAGTGADALRFIRENQPPLVLLDVMLPDMSGLDVLPFGQARISLDPGPADLR